MNCLAFLPRTRPGDSEMRKSSSEGPSSSTMDQFGFSILTTTGVPRWVSLLDHQLKEGAISGFWGLISRTQLRNETFFLYFLLGRAKTPFDRLNMKRPSRQKKARALISLSERERGREMKMDAWLIKQSKASLNHCDIR